MENKHYLTENEAGGIRDLLEVARANQSKLIEQQRNLIERLDPSQLRPEAEMLAESEQGYAALQAAAEARDLTPYLSNMKAQTAELADQELSFETIGQALVELIRPIGGMIEEAFPKDSTRAIRALRSLHLLESEFLLAAGAAFAAAREDTVESEFRETIRRLSTPVINVWDHVLVMPLIGVLDSGRAQQMMEQLLERVAAREARYVIIDITGVPTVDTGVADHLIKTTKAAGLVGAKTLLVGISPRVAQTLVRLGVSLGDVVTFTDLRSGLAYALEALDFEVKKRSL